MGLNDQYCHWDWELILILTCLFFSIGSTAKGGVVVGFDLEFDEAVTSTPTATRLQLMGSPFPHDLRTEIAYSLIMVSNLHRYATYIFGSN